MTVSFSHSWKCTWRTADPNCAQCCAVPWVQWKWQTLHCPFQKTWGNRVLNENCHHSYHCNSAEVTWLSPSFISAHRSRQSVRNHLALQTVVQVGEWCICQHSHISPWKGHFAEESTKDSPQWGWHLRVSRDFQHRGSRRMVLLPPLHLHVYYTTHQEVSMKTDPSQTHTSWVSPT